MPILHMPGTNNCEISLIEEEFEFCLPLIYREHMKSMNGLFVQSPDFIDLKLDRIGIEEISFCGFLFMGCQNLSWNLQHLNRNFGDEIVGLKKPLLIGDDGGGNFYVMETQSADGKVYYWDRTHLHGDSYNMSTGIDLNKDLRESNEEGDLYLIYDGFGVLLEIIKEKISGMKLIQVKEF